jgi:HD superfamily phosphohydrolase
MSDLRIEEDHPILFRRKEPDWLACFSQTPEMQRLLTVGMNCGCEYTAFPRFWGLRPYSRYRHSLGTARIVWDFTGDAAQTIAALFHDIATPTFAHSVDFLRGDHLRQEATEADTERIIRCSGEIARVLERLEISVDQVADYHCYPIADNDAPRLSADRLEYTLGNLDNYGFCSRGELQAYYDALTVSKNEDGEPELSFRDLETASAFGLDALRCSRVYVSDEDRYAMQMLAELLERAIRMGVIREEDLLTTEPQLIALLRQNRETAAEWDRFCALSRMTTLENEAPETLRRVIPAKKRYIDPLVAGKGRLSRLEPTFAQDLQTFLQEPQDHWICGR